MPEAVALMWKMLKDQTLDSKEKVVLLLDFDKVFGLGLATILEMAKKEVDEESIPEDVLALSEARVEARANKEWDKADALRVEIEARGYEVKDIEKGVKLKKI
jgi:cysteinyl-tRNA synthetase